MADPIDPWDLDHLAAERLHVAYRDLERFVELAADHRHPGPLFP